MSGLAIQLDRFSSGPSKICSAEIYPVHKQKAQEYLTQIFKDNIPETSKDRKILLKLTPNNPKIFLGEKEFSLPKSSALKNVDRIVRHYQHANVLARPSLTAAKEQDRVEKMKKSVQAVNDSSIPGTKGTILAGARLADDTLSLSRNILRTLPMFGPNSQIVNHLGYYAGVFWSFLALRELDGGATEYKRANTIGDEEGRRRAISRLFSGTVVSAGMLTFLGGKVCETFASASSASTVLGVSDVLFGVGSVVAIGTSLLGAVRCSRFGKGLREYLKNPALTEQQRMRGAIHFLKDSISVTPEEMAEIKADIEKEHPDWSQKKKEQLFLQKVTDLTEIKVKYAKRRTSNKSLRLIAQHADRILAKLDSSDQSAEGIRQATILLDIVQQDNRIKMGLHILTFIAGVISFIAMLVLAFASAGIAPFILYGISGTIYLGVTLYTMIGSKHSHEKYVDI